MLIGWYYIDEIDKCKKRKIHEKILILMGKILPTKKMINPKKIFYKIDKLLQKYPYDKSNNVGTIMGAYKTREIVPKEYFGEPTDYSFEGLKLKGPEMYHEYLTHMYGNYMVPPKNKEANQHLVYKQ
jgi:lipopolysaccharide cholinephosphotransferase